MMLSLSISLLSYTVIFQAEKFGDSFVLETFISKEVLKGISQAVSMTN
jgi:hypothetical protein